jgi:integral membrane sensor domain MASE1
MNGFWKEFWSLAQRRSLPPPPQQIAILIPFTLITILVVVAAFRFGGFWTIIAFVTLIYLTLMFFAATIRSGYPRKGDKK